MTEKRPDKIIALFLSVMTVIFSAFTFISMKYASVLVLLPLFIASVASLTCVFYWFRNPLAVALPFLAFAVNLKSPVTTLACGWFILICALVIFLCLIKKVDTFPMVLAGAATYAVIIGGSIVALMVYYFGSVGNALDVFRNLYNTAVTIMFAQLGDAVSMYVDMFDDFIMTFPAVLMIIGLICMWVTKWFISLISHKVTGTDSIFRKRTHVPTGFAFAFLLLSLASIFITFADVETYFVFNNIESVLMFIFFGEGIRAYFYERGPKSRRKNPAMTVILMAVLMFIIPSLVVLIIAYYGVFKTFRRKVVVISRKQ